MTPYEQVRDWARLFLQHERQNGVATSLQGIQEAVSKAASIGDDEGFTDADSEKLIAELESYYEHSIGRPSSLSTDEDNTWAPWVSDRRGRTRLARAACGCAPMAQTSPSAWFAVMRVMVTGSSVRDRK